MYRVVTVAREYGSGGGEIARLLAQRLGWKLLDRSLIDEIAREARVEPGLVERYDERVDPWFHRLSKQALWRGAFEGVAALSNSDIIDAEALAVFTRRVIEEAGSIGNCVVVGRGAQCALRQRRDTFHLFIYAPRQERIRRVRSRRPAEEDVESHLLAVDRERAAYIRLHYDQDWSSPYLYDLMINSTLRQEVVITAILTAMATAAKGA